VGGGRGWGGGGAGDGLGGGGEVAFGGARWGLELQAKRRARSRVCQNQKLMFELYLSIV